MSLTAKTRLVGLLGYPVEHSLSPAMHGAALAALGLDWAYVPLPTPPERLREALRGLVALGFRGANLTIPHKETAVPFLDDLSPEARSLGAVNTVVVDDGRLVGYNTDADGFLAALVDAHCEARRAVVLGAGGAARAVVYALRKQGATVLLANRDRERAERLAACPWSLPGSMSVIELTADSLNRALSQADLLVHATPVGMWPETQKSPLPEGAVLPGTITVMDLVYNPVRTVLLHQVQRAGARTIDGLGMLVHQGAAALRLWTGSEAPLDVMRQAVLTSTGQADANDVVASSH